MKQLQSIGLALVLASASINTSALAMGPDEFVAARQLTCVLAQESLGYLKSDEYGQLSREVLDGYDAAESDVIYAKALGYYDGLMFGLPESNERAISARLQEFVGSQACTQYTNYQGVSLQI